MRMDNQAPIQVNFFVPLTLVACEALSWAVVGELLLLLPGTYAPLYPDTMANYDNIWLQGERDRDNFAIMNRLGGQIEDNLNLWAMAQSDPRLVADWMVRQHGLDVMKRRNSPQAEMAFRIAHWLLESAPSLNVFNRGSFEAAPGEYTRMCEVRHIENLGNRDEYVLGADAKQHLPVAWHSTEPRWLNILYADGKAIASVNMQTGEHHKIIQTVSGLPTTVLREDGLPGCPLGSTIIATRNGETSELTESLAKTSFRVRYFRREDFTVTDTPIMSFIDNEPWWFTVPNVLNDYLGEVEMENTNLIPEQVRARIRETAPEGASVLPDSLPVLSFGNHLTARVATIGLNPSDQEFLGKDEWLLGDNRRLHSLKSLGVDSPSALTDEQVNLAYEEMLTYFTRNPLKNWFNAQNKILKSALDADYYEGTACHLDLVQWATSPKQSDIPAQTWQQLVDRDREFLEWQLSTTSATTIVMISQGTVSALVTAGIAPELQQTKLEIDGIKQTITVYFGEKDGRTWIGWNLALYQPVSSGLPELLVKAIQDHMWN